MKKEKQEFVNKRVIYKEYQYILMGYFVNVEKLISDIYDYMLENHYYFLQGKKHRILISVLLYNILDRLGFEVSMRKFSILANTSIVPFKKIDAELRRLGIMEFLNKQIYKKDYNIILKQGRG